MKRLILAAVVIAMTAGPSLAQCIGNNCGGYLSAPVASNQACINGDCSPQAAYPMSFGNMQQPQQWVPQMRQWAAPQINQRSTTIVRRSPTIQSQPIRQSPAIRFGNVSRYSPPPVFRSPPARRRRFQFFR